MRAEAYEDLTGPPQVVQARIADLEADGRLLALTPPRPCGGGWRVRVWVAAGAQPAERREPAGRREPYRVPRTALPPPPGPWRPGLPAWLTPQVARRAGGVAAVLAVLGVTGWLLVRAVTSAAAWTADHTGQIVAALALTALGGLAWLGRKLGRRRQAPGCTTTTVHARRCRGH